MRKGFFPALGALFVGTAQVFGQASPTSSPQTEFRFEKAAEAPDQSAVPTMLPKIETKDPVTAATMPSACPPLVFCPTQHCYRIWASSEYLMWWVKDAPLPIPLVTTGSVADPNPGAIGQPGTRVLLGDSNLGMGTFSGTRFTIGGWLNADGNVGIEASGFLLERRTARFSTSSDSAGNPVLAFPFFNQTPGFAGQDALRIADPRPIVGQFAGSVSVASTLQLWGAEANGVFLAWSKPGREITLLAGLRYVDLQESLQIINQTNDISVTPNNVTVLQDHFGTRNQFYGGQIGARVAWQYDRLSFDATGKVALGANHESVDIAGQSSQFGPNAPNPGTFPGGFYAQSSNIGNRSENQFAVLPTLELKVGYQLTNHCRLFAGYDIIYWNQVVRPGNEIDRNVNVSQSAVLFPGATPAGPASPTPLFNRTDFWAQGVNFGLEFRY